MAEEDAADVVAAVEAEPLALLAEAQPRRGGAALAQLPYDVTGWTLPMQMGVEVVAVAEPVSAETRRTLQAVSKIEPIPGKVEGSGPVFSFSHNSNAAVRAVNDILAAGGSVSFAKTESAIYATGAAASILQKDGVDAASIKETPAGAMAGEEAAHRALRTVGRQHR